MCSYRDAAEDRTGAVRMTLGLAIIPDAVRGDMDAVATLLEERDRLQKFITQLCEAANRVILAAPASGPLWHESKEIKELLNVLLPIKKQ